jgi:arylsulfatase A-like enzyme
MSLSRRGFFEKAAVAGALGGAWAGAQSGPPSGRPNILYIIQEDIGPNHACYGEPLVKTPNVDRMAAQGVRFTNVFCTGPVCSASRSALMSGRYQNNIGAHNHRTWEWHKRPLPAPAGHISEWFRNAGYFTCNLQPERGKRKPLNGAGGSGKLDLNFVLTGANKDNFFDGSDWNERKAGQPFFAHITIMETHKGGGWTLARQQAKSELIDPEKLKLGAYYPDSPVARDEYANYLDALHLSDGYVGQLLRRLEDEGLARNTVVVLSSDHGPLFRGKQFLYDGGMRIPLIVRLPDGRPAGAVDNRLVSGIDLAPTLLGFAGIRPPAGAMQGQDIFGPAYQPRTHVFAARDRMDTSIDRMRTVRTDRYKYIRNYFPMIPYMQHNEYKEQNYPTWNLVKDWAKRGKLTNEQSLFAAAEKPMEELFDIQADPDEVRNLAGDPQHRDTLKRLRGLVDGFVDENDRLVNFEDPVDVYRGYYKHLPEDPQ